MATALLDWCRRVRVALNAAKAKQQVKHVCGAYDFDTMRGHTCPACEIDSLRRCASRIVCPTCLATLPEMKPGTMKRAMLALLLTLAACSCTDTAGYFYAEHWQRLDQVPNRAPDPYSQDPNCAKMDEVFHSRGAVGSMETWAERRYLCHP